MPKAGEYLVQASDDASGPPKGTGSKGYAPLASPQPPSVDSGPAISVGQSPWTPGGSKLLGAILCGVAVMALVLALTLPFRRFLAG